MESNKVKNEITNMFKWFKKTKVTVDLPNQIQNGHCNNFASHCCLNCDKCWGAKPKTQK